MDSRKLKVLVRHRASMAGLGLILLLGVMAALIGLLSPHDPVAWRPGEMDGASKMAVVDRPKTSGDETTRAMKKAPGTAARTVLDNRRLTEVLLSSGDWFLKAGPSGNGDAQPLPAPAPHATG